MACLLDRYLSTLIATCCCNVVCIVLVLGLGSWMRLENIRRDRKQGHTIRQHQNDTSQFKEGEQSPEWRTNMLNRVEAVASFCRGVWGR
ncbi:uncharacterized protein N7529_001868 [Penicillium soppii]|uniref:uncharacterized protein n=1 Tax=Penicillium soppii TaxID=69789 RepID=UPI002549232E|nr:uncharacterized protein N7529_001868 [Penicillium soppii]KAJ5876284.1 hypothetical protein N7529_001868 [Penicillium soppii]